MDGRDEIAFRSAASLCRDLRERRVGSRELLEHLLARVERLNPSLGAVVGLDAEGARRAADAADAALARGDAPGPLHGLPMSVKDVFETAGLRTTAGSPLYADHVPARDAVAVARLRRAGAVVFAKTNTPALAMDWQTTNPLFGTTRNPWDPDRTPGGSSGGSAAALAAGLSPLELGSDIGGSIRNPAHSCGVFGHKPTWGLVPQRGHIPPRPGWLGESDINVVGPMARSAEDLALALDVLAGPPEDAAAGWRLALPPPRRQRLRDYRVAAWLDAPHAPVSKAVRGALESACEALRAEGVRVDASERPSLDLAEAQRLYRRLVSPVLALPLPGAVRDALFAATTAPDEEVSRTARDMGQRHLEWLEAHEEREAWRARWAGLFREVDVLLCPVSPVPAIGHDHREPMTARRIRVDGAERPYTDLWSWMGPFGAALLPVTVAPVGRSAQGLPVGVQIVAGHLQDRTALDFAARLEALLGGFQAPPAFA